MGFKSFKDRTVIHFDAGITGVVGPNGCGKSNIVDALVWVMGEMSAKHLRGSSMEDVIFAGAENYAPLGMAEVSLTLENDGGPFPVRYLNHKEVMVTRRLFRNGESEYLINKEAARLRDIQEIFMDTGAGAKGFSIIEQGAIGKIVTAKPEDRKSLIEEAAGITKFKVRKKESQRKLVSTEQNLVRLQDIIAELKRQLEGLQRQAKKAERYREVKKQIEDLDLWLSSVDYFEIKEKLERSELALREAQNKVVDTDSGVSTLELDIQSLKALMTEKEHEINAIQISLKEKQDKARVRETEIQELKFEIEQARRNKEMTGGMLQESNVRKDTWEKELQSSREKLALIAEVAEKAKIEFEQNKLTFDQTQKRIRENDEIVTVARRELIAVGQAESALSSKLQADQEILEESNAELDNSQEVLAELQNQKEGFNKHYKSLNEKFESERQMQLSIMNDVENFEANRNQLLAEKDLKLRETQEFKDKLNEVSSLLYGLENLQDNFEGFQKGVKSLMHRQKLKLEKIPESQWDDSREFQPLAEVLEVEKEFEMVMEASLGPKLQILLSRDQDTAVEAVSFLKSNKSGRSSFVSQGLELQVETTHENNNIKNETGVLGLLSDFVKVSERYKNTAERLIGNICVVESLDDGLKLKNKYPQFNFVSRHGDLISVDGVISGGDKEGVDSGVLKRQREIKELTLSRDEWTGKLSLAQMALVKVEERFKTVSEELEKAKRNQNEKEILVLSLQKDMERSEGELKNADRAIEKQQEVISRLQAKVLDKQEEISAKQEKVTEFKEKILELEIKIQKLNEELQSSRHGIDELQARVTTLQVEAARSEQEKESLQRDCDRLQRSLDDVEAQLDRMSEETSRSLEVMSSSQVSLEEKKVELEILIQRLKEEEETVAQKKNLFEIDWAKINEMQTQLSSQISQKSQVQAAINEAQLEFEQARMREANLFEQIREKYHMELDSMAHNYKNREGDLKQARVDLSEAKDKLGKMGDVNLAAIEEFDDVANRYEFLKKQYDDLIEAKEQLKKVIDRINRICSKRFKETFEAVNDRFTKVFPVLFGGGEARLILVEDPEKDEMGIDIVAKPPGKKLQSVSLLSGGEKALTAVSLIFSIFLVKPSPYCLLDEVDAPLDDANVMRFNELVKEMARRSQIIVVTHNKYTMEIAEKLYGVTMEEKGVSKMVSVDLNKTA